MYIKLSTTLLCQIKLFIIKNENKKKGKKRKMESDKSLTLSKKKIYQKKTKPFDNRLINNNLIERLLHFFIYRAINYNFECSFISHIFKSLIQNRFYLNTDKSIRICFYKVQ